MIVSSKCVRMLLVVFSALMASIACKPETPPNRAPQSGAQISPLPTPAFASAISVSPLLTPVPSPTPIVVTPQRSPWPITPSLTPTLPPIPEGVPYIITDTVNHFRVTVLPGWYAMTPDPIAVGGVTSITTYDMYHTDKLPSGSMEIQIFTQLLNSGQSFEEWLSVQRIRQVSPDYGGSGVTLSEVRPYALGPYMGVAYTEHKTSEKDITIISLLTSDRQIISIDLKPADSSMFSDAKSILSTLEVFPISSPETY